MSKNAAVAIVERGQERRLVLEKGRLGRIQGKMGGNARNSRMAASLELTALDSPDSLYSQNEVALLVRQDGNIFLLLRVLSSLYTLRGKTRSLRRSVGGDEIRSLNTCCTIEFIHLYPTPVSSLLSSPYPTPASTCAGNSTVHSLGYGYLRTRAGTICSLDNVPVAFVRNIDRENGPLEDNKPARFFHLDQLEVIAALIDPDQARLLESDGAAQYLSEDGA